MQGAMRRQKLSPLFFAALLLFFLLGCVIWRYSTEFPGGLRDHMDLDWFLQDDQVLVLPCWRWTDQQNTHLFGPPLIVKPSELKFLEETLGKRSGLAVTPVDGHGGSAVAFPCGVVIVGSSGSIARATFLGSKEWTAVLYSAVGWDRKEVLEVLLSEDERARIEPETVRSLLGRDGQIEGADREIDAALAFVKGLPTRGDDLWREVP